MGLTHHLNIKLLIAALLVAGIMASCDDDEPREYSGDGSCSSCGQYHDPGSHNH